MRATVHEDGRRLSLVGQGRCTENQRRAFDSVHSVVVRFTFEILLSPAAADRISYGEAGMVREANGVAPAATRRAAPGTGMVQVVAETWQNGRSLEASTTRTPALRWRSWLKPREGAARAGQ